MKTRSLRTAWLWISLVVILVLPGQLVTANPPAAPLTRPPSQGLEFGPITFGAGFDPETKTPINPGTQFSSDTARLHVSFEYANVPIGTEYKGIWILDGVFVSERSGAFERTDGVMENRIDTTDGLPLPEGIFGFTLLVDGEAVVYDQCTVGGAPEPDRPAPIDDGLPDFGQVSITDEYDETLDEPVGSARQFDYGVTALYFYCSFENMPDGAMGITTAYHDQEFLYQNDIVFDFSEGMWWEVVENPDGSPLARGKYSVIFEVDGRVAAIGDCVVGGASEPSSPTPLAEGPLPTFGPMYFTTEFDTQQNRPIGSASALAPGTDHFYAYASFETETPGALFYVVSRYVDNANEFVFNSTERYGSTEGLWWEEIRDMKAGKLRPGAYRVMVFVDDQKVGTGEITVGSKTVTTPLPSDGAAPSFGSITFCEDVTEDGTPINPRDHFPAGTKSVTALFTYQNMEDGMSWGDLWLRDSEVYIDGTGSEWDEGTEGWTAYYIEEDDGSPLSGEFTLTLYIDDAPVQHGTFQVDPPVTGEDVYAPRLGSIVFCEDVTDSGQPVNPTDYFPEGAKQVWAYFAYENMEPGMVWGRYWTLDGEEYIDSSNEQWEDGRFGWTSYAIMDENGLPAGEYSLTLYLGDQAVQDASVEVAEYAGPTGGYFGEIAFAEEMTDAREPVRPSRRFDFGVGKVYAIFSYYDMSPGQLWAAEWTQNGETSNYTGDIEWGEGPADGVTYLSFDAPEDQVMASGEYGINLYLDSELVRSATFAIEERPGAGPPARPEDIMDPDLLPAWRQLASCPHPTIQELANVTLKYHIPVRFGDVGNANASYVYNGEKCNTQPGQVKVSREAWNELTWEEVASKIGHELWHATQLLEGGYSCDCTVQKEVEAKIVELYVLRCLGRDDILLDKWSGLWYWDENRGTFDKDKLWRALEEAYSHCAKYEP